MKFVRYITIFILIFGFLLLCFGGVLSFYSTRDNTSSSKNNSTLENQNSDNNSNSDNNNSYSGGSVNDLMPEEFDQLYDQVHNESQNLLIEHCIDSSLCITDMTITFADDVVIINVTLNNKSTMMVAGNFINFDFLDSGGKTIASEFIDFPNINPGESTTVQILSTKSKIVQANDYTVRYSTDKEKEKYANLLE